MTINYYYIDDDPKAQIEEIAKGLSINTDTLLVKAYQPKKWEDILTFLVAEQRNFDGLLIDWGLTQANELGENPNFTVEALAQQIRRQVTESDQLKKDFPIVLCSAQYNFHRIYNKELSSHDLFDIVYEKDTFNDENKIVINELASLGNGYKWVHESISNPDIPNPIEYIFKLDVEAIDYRIVDYLQHLIGEKKPIHEICRFILSRIIRTSGPLINKYTLSARLGFNFQEQTAEDLEKLYDILKDTKYNGVFAQGWERWWMNILQRWWEATFDNIIFDLDAQQRVELLNNKFEINLKAAKPSKFSKSDFFWNSCKETNVPISIEDSVIRTAPIDRAPWEDDEFFSIDVALEKDSTEVHPLERERLEKLKRFFTVARKKQ